MTITIVSKGQAFYTDDEADFMAELAGYGTFGGADWADDHGYHHCCVCGGYMIEPSGYHEQYQGTLCDVCAKEPHP